MSDSEDNDTVSFIDDSDTEEEEDEGIDAALANLHVDSKPRKRTQSTVKKSPFALKASSVMSKAASIPFVDLSLVAPEILLIPHERPSDRQQPASSGIVHPFWKTSTCSDLDENDAESVIGRIKSGKSASAYPDGTAEHIHHLAHLTALQEHRAAITVSKDDMLAQSAAAFRQATKVYLKLADPTQQ